ncbi:MAG TPA: hypothetical protein DDW52_00125 [Planctomycetaceae bacterium]|nr:hypothetical protein [Planctomycetaceae bacterium]
MRYILGFVIAIGLAIAAAATNWLYLASATRPTAYVAMDNSIKPGQEIKSSDLRPIPIPGDASLLRQSMIPFDSKSILVGRTATRAYLEGDVVLSRDLTEQSTGSQWRVVGPFELISVGERFKQDSGRGAELASTRGNNVTIAVDANFDEQTSRLLAVIAGLGQRSQSARQQSKIVAVQVVPGPANSSTAARENTSKAVSTSAGRQVSRDIVYQTVSLDGIANVPSVLLEGEFIRFVVPD